MVGDAKKMSMEGGWDLDDVPAPGTCPDGIEGCNIKHRLEDGPPLAHWLHDDDSKDIGEPESASIDELPKAVVDSKPYWYIVDTAGPNGVRTRYSGKNAADAMVAFATAILDGKEYVTLEAMREQRSDKS